MLFMRKPGTKTKGNKEVVVVVVVSAVSHHYRSQGKGQKEGFGFSFGSLEVQATLSCALQKKQYCNNSNNIIMTAYTKLIWKSLGSLLYGNLANE